MSTESKGLAYAEPDYAKPSAITEANKPPFYVGNIDKYLTPENREIFEQYSKIPADQLSKHIHAIRDKAWAIRVYPCTGLGVWAVPYICRSQAYAAVLERLKSGAILLDIGCFLGADMRRLVFDGAPSENLYGIDIANHWDLGFELYRDQDRYKGSFIESDMLSQDNPELLALHDKVDIISISAIFHQWSWEDQVEAAKRVVLFSKPGTMVLGYLIGHPEAKSAHSEQFNVTRWIHNPDSFARMWDEVGSATGTQWKTTARLMSWEDVGWDADDMGFLGPGASPLDFVVTRL